MYILREENMPAAGEENWTCYSFIWKNNKTCCRRQKIFGLHNWPINGSFGGKRGVFTQIFVVGRGLWPQGVGVPLASGGGLGFCPSGGVYCTFDKGTHGIARHLAEFTFLT